MNRQCLPVRLDLSVAWVPISSTSYPLPPAHPLCTAMLVAGHAYR